MRSATASAVLTPVVAEGRAERLDTLADHVRRVLDADRVLLTSVGAGAVAARTVAAAGAGDLSAPAARLLEKHEQQLADSRSRPDVHGRVRGRRATDGTWWSTPVRSRERRLLGTLHVLVPAGWVPDPRTQRMTSVFVGRFARALAFEGPRWFSDRTMLVLAREMSDLALTADTYQALMGGVTASVAPLLDASKTGIGLWHGDSHYLQLLPGSFGSNQQMAASAQIRGSDPRSGAARVRMTGEPYYTNDLEVGIPRYAPWLRAMGVRNLMTLPIPIEDRIAGVLHVANKATDFVDADMEQATELVPLVAGAMEHVRHRLETRRKERLATVVSRAGTAIAQGEPLNRLKTTVLDEFCTTIGACMLAISFSTDAPPIIVRPGPTDAAFEHPFLAASAAGGTAMRTATRRPRAALDVGWSALHAPVMIGGQREATFSILRVPCEAFSKDEMAVIRRMANITALAWATERFHNERLEAARMRERQRIADDLHDHVAQILFSGQLTIQSILEQLGDGAPLRPEVARARDLLARSQTSIREVIHHLSSPAPGGLLPGLSSLVEGVTAEFQTKIHVTAHDDLRRMEQDISDHTADVALKAIREAAVNAAKHASGCEVWITLRARGERMIVEVEDNGPGMPGPRRTEGYGLRATRRNLSQHGGLLRIGPSRHGGTRYLISLPRAGLLPA